MFTEVSNRVDSQVLYFQKTNFRYFDVFKNICAIYQRETGIKNPFEGRTLSDFIAVIGGLYNSPNFEDLGLGRGILLFVAFFHIWEKHKQEFVFDNYFSSELSRMEIPENLPSEVITRPPFPTLFIKDPVQNDISDGWFFLLENDTLLIMALKDQAKEKTNFKTWALDFKAGTNIKNILHFDKRDGMDSLTRALNLYLYLCSEQPELSKATLVKSANKKGKTWMRSESNLVQVGVRIGRFIKSSKETQSTSSGDGLKRVVAGHVRRAHWHHYWVGKKSEGQKLILKWVHPTLINSGENMCKVSAVK